MDKWSGRRDIPAAAPLLTVDTYVSTDVP